jgi:hypothetical protein
MFATAHCLLAILSLFAAHPAADDASPNFRQSNTFSWNASKFERYTFSYKVLDDHKTGKSALRVECAYVLGVGQKRSMSRKSIDEESADGLSSTGIATFIKVFGVKQPSLLVRSYRDNWIDHTIYSVTADGEVKTSFTLSGQTDQALKFVTSHGALKEVVACDAFANPGERRLASMKAPNFWWERISRYRFDKKSATWKSVSSKWVAYDKFAKDKVWDSIKGEQIVDSKPLSFALRIK